VSLDSLLLGNLVASHGSPLQASSPLLAKRHTRALRKPKTLPKNKRTTEKSVVFFVCKDSKNIFKKPLKIS